MSRLSGCGLILRGGKKHDETRTASHSTGTAITRRMACALHTNAAVMSVNNFRDDREAKADARFLRGHKRIENRILQVSRNAGPCIFNAHFDAVLLAAFAACGARPHFDAQRAAIRTHAVKGVLHVERPAAPDPGRGWPRRAPQRVPDSAASVFGSQ